MRTGWKTGSEISAAKETKQGDSARRSAAGVGKFGQVLASSTRLRPLFLAR